MEVYARTGAQVIIEDANPYYLKSKKAERPPIKFERLVKVEGSVFKKKKDALFGIELPKEEDLFSSDSEVPPPIFRLKMKKSLKTRRRNSPCSSPNKSRSPRRARRRPNSRIVSNREAKWRHRGRRCWVGLR
jgi:hypothetical protein